MELLDKGYIAGSWRPTHGATRYSLVNPSSEEAYGELVCADAVDVDGAVGAATTALQTWQATSVKERVAAVIRMQTYLVENRETLAREITRSMGAPISLARSLLGAVEMIDMYVESIERVRLQYLRSEPSGSTLIRREPVGVVAGITPWNGPVRHEVKKAIPALLAGCTIVLKPGPDTPYGALALVHAAEAADLPAGVLNVIFGATEAGSALVNHPGVSKIAFTGSSATGRAIGEICGRTFKRMQLELGGKSAAIVLDDVDVDLAAPVLDVANFAGSGQGCLCLTRILVPESRASEIADALVDRARAHRIGDPMQDATTIGPLVNRTQLAKVMNYIEIGSGEGAKLLTGGHRPADLPRGLYVEPTVFTQVDNGMRIAREEIFGPVASIIAYKTIDEAIAIANDSEFGLNGGVFSVDEERALDVARRIDTGTVGVNTFNRANSAPFGGVKASGVGREHGPEGYDSFLEYMSYGISDKLAATLAAQGLEREYLN